LNYRDESFEVKIVKRNLFFVFRIKNKVYCQSDSSTKHDNFHQALYYGATTFIITTFSIIDLIVTFSIKDTNYTQCYYVQYRIFLLIC
jgi:hypothetical protein